MKLKIAGTEFDEFVSLGSFCVVRWQISRSIALRLAPGLPEKELRDHILGKAHGLLPSGGHFFDWLVAPHPGVLRLLRSNFEEAFERHNLEVTPDQKHVRDRSTSFNFPHSFSHPDGIYTEAAVDAEFAEQKSKYDYLVSKFRNMVASDRKVLYVIHIGRGFDRYEDFTKAFLALNPHHSFHILFVKSHPEIYGSADERDDFTVVVINSEVRKAPEAQWTGDDEYWGDILDQIPLRIAEKP